MKLENGKWNKNTLLNFVQLSSGFQKLKTIRGRRKRLFVKRNKFKSLKFLPIGLNRELDNIRAISKSVSFLRLIAIPFVFLCFCCECFVVFTPSSILLFFVLFCCDFKWLFLSVSVVCFFELFACFCWRDRFACYLVEPFFFLRFEEEHVLDWLSLCQIWFFYFE